jgi:hypothetical protein
MGLERGRACISEGREPQGSATVRSDHGDAAGVPSAMTDPARVTATALGDREQYIALGVRQPVQAPLAASNKCGTVAQLLLASVRPVFSPHGQQRGRAPLNRNTVYP